MKKIISLAIVAVMLFTAMAAFTSFAAETGELTVNPSAFGAMENWFGGSNPDGATATFQLLVAFRSGDVVPETLKNTTDTWTLKITGSDGSEKTINVKPSTFYSHDPNFHRFETVIQDEENQWIPEGGVNYTVEATVTDSEGKTWTGKSAEGAFACATAFVANVPDAYNYSGKTPEIPETATVEVVPSVFGAMENWAGSPNKAEGETHAFQLLVLPKGSDGQTPGTLRGEDLVWTLTITGSDGSTATVETKPGTVYGGDIVRFETVNQAYGNQFIPTAGVTYTVAVEVTDANGTKWTGTSAEGAFACAADFEAYVPDRFDYVKNPPQNGDIAVYAIVFAAVAVLGMGIVVTKKVRV